MTEEIAGVAKAPKQSLQPKPKVNVISKMVDKSRTFYTLAELATLWNCTQEAILDLGANKKLTLSVNIADCIRSNHRGRDSSVQYDDSPDYPYNGPVSLSSEAIWRVLAKSPQNTQENNRGLFETSVNEILHTDEIIRRGVSQDDVVITTRSIERFANKLPPEDVTPTPKEDPRVAGMLALLYAEKMTSPSYWHNGNINVSQLVEDVQQRLTKNEDLIPTGFKNSALNPKIKASIDSILTILPAPPRPPVSIKK